MYREQVAMIRKNRKIILPVSFFLLYTIGSFFNNSQIRRSNILYADDSEDCDSSTEDPTKSGCQIWLRYSDLPDLYPKTRSLSPKEAFDLIQERRHDSDLVIIDVRSRFEFAAAHIENAINLDYVEDDFQEKLNRLDPIKTYLIYGTKEGYSANTANRLDKNITSDVVYYLSGGIDRWIAENFSTVN